MGSSIHPRRSLQRRLSASAPPPRRPVAGPASGRTPAPEHGRRHGRRRGRGPVGPPRDRRQRAAPSLRRPRRRRRLGFRSTSWPGWSWRARARLRPSPGGPPPTAGPSPWAWPSPPSSVVSSWPSGLSGWASPPGLIWPVSFGVAGVVLVWHDASSDEQGLSGRGRRAGAGARDARPADTPGPRRSDRGGESSWWAAGLGGLVATRHPTGATLEGVASAAVVITGFLIVFGPWWLALAATSPSSAGSGFGEERARHGGAHPRLGAPDPGPDPAVRGRSQRGARLARAQERELRAWLFEGHAAGIVRAGGDHRRPRRRRSSPATSRRSTASPSSPSWSATAPDDDLRALLAAGREAAVNAAKWSGATTVSVYVEVEPTRVSMFVRDRGGL